MAINSLTTVIAAIPVTLNVLNPGLGLLNTSTTINRTQNSSSRPMLLSQTLPCNAVTTVSPPFSITTVQETNVRLGRSTSSGLVKKLPANRTFYIDAWGYGDAIMDEGYNPPRLDARWYKLQNENGWVASAVVKGDAPNSSPTCSTGQPALFPNPTSSNPLRGFLHPLKGAGNRPTSHIKSG